MTIRVTAMDHIVLRVRDLDSSLRFYEGLLDLDVEGRSEFSSGLRPFVSVRVGDQLIDLLPDDEYDSQLGTRHGGLFHFCLRIAGNLETDVIPPLRRAGIELLEPNPSNRFGATGYGNSIYVRDPDGYMLELKESS